MSASLELQRALVAALGGDAWLAARMAGVWDAVPPGVKWPYLTVGPDVVTDWSTKTGAGREHRLRVTVWEAALSVARCGEAMERVEAVVLGLVPVMSGHRLVSMRFVRAVMNDDADGGPVRGLVEFRARTQAV